MINDPIIQEIRESRDRHAAQFEYDLKKIAEDLRKSEQQSQRKIVSLPPKQPLKATGS